MKLLGFLLACLATMVALRVGGIFGWTAFGMGAFAMFEFALWADWQWPEMRS